MIHPVDVLHTDAILGAFCAVGRVKIGLLARREQP